MPRRRWEDNIRIVPKQDRPKRLGEGRIKPTEAKNYNKQYVQ